MDCRFSGGNKDKKYEGWGLILQKYLAFKVGDEALAISNSLMHYYVLPVEWLVTK